jgi:Tol biopolymer transport system component
MTVRPDGSDVTELARLQGSTTSYVLGWAPDGNALLASARSWEPELHVIQSDGSGSRMIDAGLDTAGGPASWRPDGRQIAFMATAQSGFAAFIADVTGTNVRRLPLGPLSSVGLEWSPDGTRLSLTDSVDADGTGVTIAELDADGMLTGSHHLRLDPGLGLESAATWSPDGRHLALRVRRDAGLHFGIFEPDGTGFRIVGPRVSPVLESDLTWSPDGRWLIVSGHVLQEDPDTRISRHVEKAWSVNVASGEPTEVLAQVDTWQRLEP